MSSTPRWSIISIATTVWPARRTWRAPAPSTGRNRRSTARSTNSGATRKRCLARDRRNEIAVAGVIASQDELRASIGSLQQAAQNLKREVSRLVESGVVVQQVAAPAGTVAVAGNQLDALDSHKYVGFEDRFRGSSDDIRQRVSEYLPFFDGRARCARHRLRQGRVPVAPARPRASRPAASTSTPPWWMSAASRGWTRQKPTRSPTCARQPDGSLGGLFAAQVVEHLEPRYLTSLLDAAFDKLRPGSPIVLETINPACWFAFFESYIRDITHVRPIHPDTLSYLLIATGFQHVDVRYRAPYPEHDKLQRMAPNASLGDAVDTLECERRPHQPAAVHLARLRGNRPTPVTSAGRGASPDRRRRTRLVHRRGDRIG